MKTSILFILASYMLFVSASCKKKENETIPPSYIQSRTLNIFLNGVVYQNVSENVDKEMDGNLDFQIYTRRPFGLVNFAQVGVISVNNIYFPMEFATYKVGIGSDFWLSPLFQANDSIHSNAGVWKDSSIIFFSDFDNFNPSLGLNNQGPAFISFRFRNLLTSSSNYYYGWIKVDVSDRHNVNLMELGYHTLPNTPIKAGEK